MATFCIAVKYPRRASKTSTKKQAARVTFEKEVVKLSPKAPWKQYFLKEVTEEKSLTPSHAFFTEKLSILLIIFFIWEEQTFYFTSQCLHFNTKLDARQVCYYSRRNQNNKEWQSIDQRCSVSLFPKRVGNARTPQQSNHWRPTRDVCYQWLKCWKWISDRKFKTGFNL